MKRLTAFLLVSLLLCGCGSPPDGLVVEVQKGTAYIPETFPDFTEAILAATEVVTEPATIAAETPTEEPTEIPTQAPTQMPEETTEAAQIQEYVLNTSTRKFHHIYCNSVGKMKAKNRQNYWGSAAEILSMGYSACKICKP